MVQPRSPHGVNWCGASLQLAGGSACKRLPDRTLRIERGVCRSSRSTLRTRSSPMTTATSWSESPWLRSQWEKAARRDVDSTGGRLAPPAGILEHVPSGPIAQRTVLGTSGTGTQRCRPFRLLAR